MIYFVQENEPNRRRIKIGYTSKDDVTQRLKELQTSSPTNLRVLAVMEGDVTKETWVHSLFDRERVVGEWFEPSPRLAGFIRYFTDGSVANTYSDSVTKETYQQVPPGIADLIKQGAFIVSSIYPAVSPAVASVPIIVGVPAPFVPLSHK